MTQLKEQNIKHARWLRGSAARPLMRWLSWMELNITWKQLGGKKTMEIQWMWPWVDNDDHAAERIYLHLQHGFCLVGQKRKKERNAKCRLFVYFHIFCVRGRNSTSLKHFIDYLTNYWNCKFFSLLLVKGCFGVYRLPLNCKTAFCGGWTSATLIINSQWQFIWLPRLEKTLQNIVFSGIIKQNRFAFRVIVRGACVRAQRKITN